MTTTNKDFKVKNGIVVSDGGTFGGPVIVGTPVSPGHAITKEYLENILSNYMPIDLDGGGVDPAIGLDGGDPTTTTWSATFDGGTL